MRVIMDGARVKNMAAFSIMATFNKATIAAMLCSCDLGQPKVVREDVRHVCDMSLLRRGVTLLLLQVTPEDLRAWLLCGLAEEDEEVTEVSQPQQLYCSYDSCCTRGFRFTMYRAILIVRELESTTFYARTADRSHTYVYTTPSPSSASCVKLS